MASTINITKSSPGNIIITGKWTWYDYYKVEYFWENAPDGVTLPETINKIKNGSIIAVDNTYSSSSEVDTNDYYYTFSGWNKSGNITVNADTTITGIWTQNRYLTVSYSWTDAPTSVTLPNSTTRLKSGDSVTVDTTYNSSSEVDTDNYYYTFSGWNKSGNIIVTSDTVISGVWTQKNYLSVSYSWSNAPSNVILPSTVNKLKPNDTVTVDTTYNSDSEVDTDTCYYTFSGWNQSGDIIVTSDTVISGVWTIHDYLKVSYSWTNAPSSVTLPKTVTKLKPGDSVTVDTTYNSSSEVDTNDYYYTFSGWNKSGNITVNADTTITGIWTQNRYLTVSYSWTDAPNGVTLPNSTTKLKPGDSVTVDTTYTSDNIVEEITNDWSESTISSTSRNLYYLNYCNDKFIALATGSNYFEYSTDGITWTESTISDTNRDWRTVCYGNGVYVAFALSSNYFAYSTDGITWTDKTLPASRNWYSMCYGNGMFVVVTYNSNYFAYSTDGINWTESTISSTSRQWESVCYGGGKYITVAKNSNYFAYSTDGITWTEGIISSTERKWSSVCYGNSKFIAIANGTIFAYSTNGINWTESTISSTSIGWQSICYGNGKYVAVSYSNNISAYSTLSDPGYYYQFSGWDQSGNITITSDTIITGIWNHKNYLTVSYSWTDAPSTLVSVIPDSVVGLMPGNIVSINKTYTNLTAKKDVNNTWETAYVLKDRTGNEICYGNGKFIVVSNSNYFYYSTDGINWTESTISDTSRNWVSVCYGNDKFVAVANKSNYFAYSTDGITWTESTISSTSRRWWSVCYGNGMFVVVGYNLNSSNKLITGNNFAYSTDGINWTEGTISDGLSKRYWYSVCYGNDKFVVISGGIDHISVSNYFAYSTDGINWTESTISNSTTRCWKDICYGNDKFVIVGANYTGGTNDKTTTGNTFAYSTDGITWTEGMIDDTEEIWESVCYGNGKFIATEPYSSNNFAYSYDGINWVYSSKGMGKGLMSAVICYGNGKFVCIGQTSYVISYYPQKNGTKLNIVYSTLGDLYYQFSGWDQTGNITVNNNTEITGSWSKKDLDYNWTKTTICSTSRAWRSICYGNGKFVATAFQKAMAYSTDGITWTEYSFNGTSSSNPWLESICYGNGKFVIVIDNSKYFAYSSDGITWTEVMVSDTSRRWGSVCYGNGMFVAVTGYTNDFAYSTDGITWTEATISNTSRDWRTVCYGNDKFVVVGYNIDSNSDLISGNDFAYSTDGITWTEGTISSTSRRWTSVCYGNGKFVAVAGSSNYFAYSSDGITWTEVMISDTERYWNSVCYGDGKFVAVGTNSYFAYSSDGITWTEGTISSTSNNWGSVCYGDGKFVAVMKRDKSKVCAYYSKQFPSNLNYID